MVVFTANAKNSIETIKKNVISVNENATIEMCDAIEAISRFGGISDLFFVDPPYPDFNFGVLFVKKLSKIAKNGAVLIWEFENTQKAPDLSEYWDILRDKTYGRARFLILQKK